MEKLRTFPQKINKVSFVKPGFLVCGEVQVLMYLSVTFTILVKYHAYTGQRPSWDISPLECSECWKVLVPGIVDALYNYTSQAWILSNPCNACRRGVSDPFITAISVGLYQTTMPNKK